MESDHDASAADEYYMTAVQIFDYCGGESSGTIRVDTLMEKFAPFVKTNKSEFVYLKSLLDPEQSNPEISTAQLATALSQYTHNTKSKVDLDESFNLKCGPMPQDSDSGISTDGFHLLEELQSELREKSHLMQQLRSQLEFSDRQHDEVASALTHERDALRAHLNILREENMSLSHVKSDYEETCDRLCVSEEALSSAKQELETLRKKAKAMDDQIQALETEKLTLQELLAKSKAECHRINEMYASRQSVLLEENETLRAEHADLSVKLQDHEEFVQQVIKEKVVLEMELKDVVNKSNATQQRLDRSIDVSYTDDQMLSALDSINVDSRFVQERHVLDEEAFSNALKEEQGRSTNLSLFDEIRLSMSNSSRQQFNYDVETSYTCGRSDDFLDTSLDVIETQKEICDAISTDTQTEVCDSIDAITIETQTEFRDTITIETQTEICDTITIDTQTEFSDTYDKKGDSETGNTHCPKCSKNKVVTDETSSTHVAIQTEVLRPPVKILARNYDLAHGNILRSTEIQAQVSHKTEDTQTVIDKENTTQKEPENNNNDCSRCTECENQNNYTKQLESDLKKSRETMSELQDTLDGYEQNLNLLQKCLNEGSEQNAILHAVVQGLQSKLTVLEAVCVYQKERTDCVVCDVEHCTAECQTDSDQSSVATQVEVPCKDCVQRSVSPQRAVNRYLWDPLKTLFQLCAVACFLCALSVVYSLTARWRARCRQVPWRWLDAHELIDMLLRIDYVNDVPM